MEEQIKALEASRYAAVCPMMGVDAGEDRWAPAPDDEGRRGLDPGLEGWAAC